MGHGADSVTGPNPDDPSNRKELYGAYVRELLSVLTAKSGKQSVMTDKDIDEFVNAVTNEKGDDAQSAKILSLARNNKKFEKLTTFDKEKYFPEEHGRTPGLLPSIFAPGVLPSDESESPAKLLARAMTLAEKMTISTEWPYTWLQPGSVVVAASVGVAQRVAKFVDETVKRVKDIRDMTIRGLTSWNNWSPGW